VLFGQDESKVKLEESPLIKMLLENPEDKSLVKEVAQKVQKFYFGDKRITFAPDSGINDVSVFCLHSLMAYPGCRAVGHLCAVECGHQICSYEHRLRVFGNKVLRRIIWNQRESEGRIK
jgi:hypothetical protein